MSARRIYYPCSTSDTAFNLAQSILQQAVAHHAFPLRIELLDSSMNRLCDEMYVTSGVDSSIGALMRAVRSCAALHAIRIHPGQAAHLELRSWVKIIGSYSSPDDRAGKDYWSKSCNSPVLVPV